MTIQADDFLSNSLSGIVDVINSQITLDIPTVKLLLEGDKTFVVKIRQNSTTGPVLSTSEPITLKDYTSVVNVTANAAIIEENAVVQFTVTTANIDDNSTLYYTTIGNVDYNDFVGGNVGSFTIANNLGIISLFANADLNDITTLIEGEEQFNIQIRSNSTTGNIVYVSNTIIILDTSNTTPPVMYVEATGGTVIDEGGYRIHVFTTTSNLSVSGLPEVGEANAEVILVAGGGGGGAGTGPGVASDTFGAAGGGGAGGFLQTNVTLSATSYVISVGGGGAGAPLYANNQKGVTGTSSTAFGLTAVGGGGGAQAAPGQVTGAPGGSGGGAGGWLGPGSGSGTFGPGTPGQGNPGGTVVSWVPGDPPEKFGGGGGGGAGGVGGNAYKIPRAPIGTPFTGISGGGAGGTGRTVPWLPSTYGTPGPAPGRYFAGGGGGAASLGSYLGPGTEELSGPFQGVGGAGGAGGGGKGGQTIIPGTAPSPTAFLNTTGMTPTSGNVNTGGGGGAGTPKGGTPNPGAGGGPAGAGGSGIVIIRYPYNP